MIAWKNTTEALGYATSRLDDALSSLGRYAQAPDTALVSAQEALNEATAALVLVQHQRMGDALVTIDQLTAGRRNTAEALGYAASRLDDALDALGRTDPRAGARRRCCQTYIGPEPHATGCATWGSDPYPTTEAASVAALGAVRSRAGQL